MKAILVIADTFRRDHASVYGDAPWGKIHTPHLARFAAEAAVFDNAYIGSFPTGPTRRDILMGHCRPGLPFNEWSALTDDEATFVGDLRKRGVPSMLISDVQNTIIRKPGIQRDFSAWTLNRGQEGDRCWMSADVPMELPVPIELIRYREDHWRQILVNRAGRQTETDWFAPKTYSIAIEWLTQNYRRPDFFLWLDTFDPHEPWDPPQYYTDMYDPNYEGRVFEAPPGGFRKAMRITDGELKHMRARYAGEVTMVDTWFGRLYETLERLGILDDTLLIFTSDHGTPFAGPADLDMIRKQPVLGADGLVASAGRPPEDPKQYMPLSLNTTRIPLIIRAPGAKKGRRVKAIAQPWDLSATILDAFGIPAPERIVGRSLLPLVQGKRVPTRDLALSGAGPLAQATTGRWMYSAWRQVRPPVLYNLQNDPECRKNVVKKEPAAARHLHARLVSYMRAQGMADDAIGLYRAD
ncbi:MAG: sulfatase [Candidatus Sumerlaeota bacterium]|nr:sulfatase [Candidatus Sumerlaeota bacterium]